MKYLSIRFHSKSKFNPEFQTGIAPTKQKLVRHLQIVSAKTANELVERS
jgi:hypothetical protein